MVSTQNYVSKGSCHGSASVTTSSQGNDGSVYVVVSHHDTINKPLYRERERVYVQMSIHTMALTSKRSLPKQHQSCT